jgi:serine phosphatase RsbU (regulator of sigma subunit)
MKLFGKPFGKFFGSILLCLCFSPFLFAQNKVDSLRLVLQQYAEKDTNYILALAEIANEYRYEKPDSSLMLAQKSLDLASQKNYTKGIGRSYRIIGIYYRNKGQMKEAVQALEKSIQAALFIQDSEGLAFAYNSLAAIHKNQANTVLTLEYALKALKEFEKTSNKKGMAYVMNNISEAYKEQGNAQQALDYAQKSLVLSEELQDKKMIFYSYFNIGEIYRGQKKYKEALTYQLKNLALADAFNEKHDKSYACVNVGESYLALQEYDKALPYLEQGLKIATEIKNEARIVDLTTALAKYYRLTKQATKGFAYSTQALQTAQKIKSVSAISLAAFEHSELAALLAKDKIALESFKLYKQMEDSLQSEQNYKLTMQKDFAYQEQKRNLEAAQEKLAHETALKEQKNIRNAVMLILAFMMGVAFFAYRSYEIKRKSNALLAKQNEEITKQTLEIADKNDELNQANEELHQQQEELVMLNDNLISQKKIIETTYKELKFTSEQLNLSIDYASDMQRIMLPEETELKQFFADVFIIFKPRNVVSGDFYWFRQLNEKQGLFALADCTGHGVPGAFMSMLGYTLLNEITKREAIQQQPAQILQELDNALRQLLRQEQSNNKDGMDISICFFDKQGDAFSMIFAGAKSILYQVENNNLTVLNGDKVYLGGKTQKGSFTNQPILANRQTLLYLLTDGFGDQNNEQRERMGTSKIKETILATYQEPFEVQKTKLLDLLATHQGSSSQRDDISLIGLKI